jgi:hypothetical protein
VRAGRGLLALGAGTGQLGFEVGPALDRLVLDRGPVVRGVRVGLRAYLLGPGGGLLGEPARLLLRVERGGLGVDAHPLGVLLHAAQLGVQSGAPVGRHLVLLGAARRQYRLEVPDRLVVLELRVAEDALGLGPLPGDALLAFGADRRGLLLGQREDLPDPVAEVPERRVGGDGGGTRRPLPRLDQFELELLQLGGERLRLRVRVVALRRQRRVLGLQQADALVDLFLVVPADGEFEVPLRRYVVAEREQVSAVRHGTILTRKVPSRRPKDWRDGTFGRLVTGRVSQPADTLLSFSDFLAWLGSAACATLGMIPARPDSICPS